MSNKETKDSGMEEGVAPVRSGSSIEDAEIIESTPVKETATRGNPSGMPRLALILALIAIAVVVGVLGYGYPYWMKLQTSLQQMTQALNKTDQQQQALQVNLSHIQQTLDAQKSAFETQRNALQAQDQRLTEERERLSRQTGELKQSMATIYDRIGRNSNAWMAAEAEYLMRVANHRLRLEEDAQTAIRALEAADGRLRDTGDPGLIEVREMVAAEVAALKGVEQLDRVGLSAKLIGLKGQIKRLKMTGLQYTRSEPPVGTAQGEAALDKRSIETLLKDGWEGFKSVMVIRHRDKPVSAMLAPEEQFFIYQNLELQLEGARLGLLKADPTLYQSSLKQALNWMGDFFDPQASPTQAVQKELTALQAVNVRPKLPDISGSLKALQARMTVAGEEGVK